MSSVLPFEQNNKTTPANIHKWLDALPLTNEQRATYGYFIYLPSTHRVLLFERDSEERFTYWCFKTQRLLHTFEIGREGDYAVFTSVSGNWLVCMNEDDAGNSQWMTVTIHYIGEGFDATKHLKVLSLYSLVSTVFEVGFDEHDNLWVDGMCESLFDGKSDFVMQYYTLTANNGEPEITHTEPCPYERMDTEGFERYQIEQSPIDLVEK